MINSEVKRELLHRLEHLPFTRQKQLLGYARMMDQNMAKGVKGKQILSFAGTIDVDDLKTMGEFIEANCESVDTDAW